MPLVPCLGFVGLAFAAIGFADLHLFGFAPSWVRVPREGIEPPRPKFQVYSLAQPTNSCLRGLCGYGVLFHPPPLGLGHSTA